jgi:hypothetical protein
MSLPATAAEGPRSDAADRGQTTSRSLVWLAAVPIGLHAVLAWLLRAPTIATGNDDAVYLLLARALRAGHYRELFYAGTPVHSQYPPGYPALLALLGAPADGGIGLVIAVNILLSCAALVLLFDVMRRWSLPLALVTVAVLAMSPSLLEAASRVQSDPLFMAATMLALWTLRPAASGRHFAVAVGALVVAALTRSIGVTVIVGVLVHFALLRQWRRLAIVGLVAGVTVGPWLAWTLVAPQKIAGRSYVADAMLTIQPADSVTGRTRLSMGQPLEKPPPAATLGRALAHRLEHNVPRYLTRSLPTELAIPTVEGTVVDNAAWLIAMFGALGIGLVAAWARWRAAVLVLVAYGALLALWPYTVSRFLTPVLPLIVALFLLGAWQFGVRMLPRTALIPALLLAAVPLGGGAQAVGAGLAARRDCPADERASDGRCNGEATRYRRIVQDLRTRLPDDARVFTTKEGTFYYWSGHPVVTFYPAVALPPDELATYWRERQADVVYLPHLKPEEQLLGASLAALCANLTDAGAPSEDQLILWTRPPAPGESDACAAVARWRATW